MREPFSEDEWEDISTLWRAPQGKIPDYSDEQGRELLKAMFRARQAFKCNDLVEYDVEGAWGKVDKQTTSHKSLKLGRRMMKYVALLILFLMTGVVGWYVFKQTAEQENVSLVETACLPKNILLQQASGETIDLSRDSAQDIFDKNGNRIRHSGDTLNYSDIQSSNSAVQSEGRYNKLIIPRGAEYFLILADRTKVWLNSESELRYPTCFSGSTREVFLTGEAYFEVTPDKQHPFLVQTGGQSVRVLGTSFNIMAYKNSDYIKTTLVTGSVEVSTSLGKAVLRPGMQSLYSLSAQTLETRPVNTGLYTSWKDNVIQFEEIRLEDLMERLGRWYDVDIFYLNTECKEVLLTGNLSKHGNIDTMLRLLETMGKVCFSKNGKTLTVMKNMK